MTNTYSYSNPVAQLFTLGRPEGGYIAADWPDIVGPSGISADDLPELIRLANDWDTFWTEDNTLAEDDPALYAIPNAIRAIGQLGTEEGAEALLALLQRNEAEDEDIDWVHEDAPSGVALAGEPALALVDAFLKSPDVHDVAKVFAASVPRYVAKADAGLREQAVAIYRSQLAQYQTHSRWLNATWVSGLVELKDVDSAELIKEAHLADAIDVSIRGDWEDAWIELGLLDERITPKQHWLAAEGEAAAAQKKAAKQLNITPARRQANAKKKQKAKRKKKKRKR